MTLILALFATATAGDVSALTADAGWKELATRSSDVGKVTVSLKQLEGLPCLRAQVVVVASTEALLEVVTDIPSAIRWGTAGITKAEILGKGDGWLDYMQYLDVPNWTLAQDRFWILRGGAVTGPDGGVVFSWDRSSDHQATRDAIAATDPKAVELPTNYGAWSFLPVEGGTRVRQEVCSDLGGSMPTSIQRWVSTRTMPDTVAEMVVEAQRRM